MNSESSAHRLLDVGNCNPDHAALRRMLEAHFHVAIDRVMHVADALALMRQNQYDLVLFNRLIFDSGAEGIELLRRARTDPQVKPAPIMMISNYPDAQAAAVRDGAVEGFGKSALDAPATIQRLSYYLSAKAPTIAAN